MSAAPQGNRSQTLMIGLVGVIFVLLGVIGFVASRNSAPPSPPTAAPTPEATATPTPEPTDSPRPQETPAPILEPGKIVFGHREEKLKIRDERERFSPDEAFAYVATSPEPFGATELEATLARKSAGDDSEKLVRRWTLEISGPESNKMSQSFAQLEAFAAGLAPGRHIFRLIRSGKTLCRGEFVVGESATPEPDETPGPESTPATAEDGWRSYRSEELGVRVSAPSDWSISGGREGEEAFVSIRKSETPPISLRLLKNPPSNFNTQESDKKKTFKKKYHRIGLTQNNSRDFHGIPAETWAFNEPSDSGVKKKILKFQFEKDGSRWEFSIVAPAAVYDSYQEDFNRIIDKIEFD